MSPAVDVSIVIVSWNTREHLVRCLGALAATTSGVVTEVVVVDNASSDGTRTMLAEKFPDVRLVDNDENVGFARAGNAGARVARGRTILFLNSDCELVPGALATLLATLDAGPDVGAALPRLVNADGTLQPSVHDGFPGWLDLLGDVFFVSSLRYAVYRRRRLARWLLTRERARHAESHDVAWGGAACLLVRRDVLVDVGGFDERFFMYWEDVDLGKRLCSAGWRIRFVAEASAIHHWGASAAQRPPAAVVAPYVSRVRYFDKHFPEAGGAVASGLLRAELTLRSAAFSAVAFVPARVDGARTHREWARERADAARASAEALAAEGPGLARTSAGVGLLLALAVAFALFKYGHDVVKFALKSDKIDLAHFYTFARVLGAGGSPYDPATVAAMDTHLGLARAPGILHPLLFYVFMQPWTVLPFHVVAVGWLVVAQIFLGLVAYMIVRRHPDAGAVPLAAAAFVILSFQPLVEDMAVGQSNVWVLLLVTLAWATARAERPWLAAVALALAIHTKPQWAVLVPLLWVGGERRVARATVVTTIGGLAVSVALFGWSDHVQWITTVFGGGGFRYVFAWNIAPRAVLVRLLRPFDVGMPLVETLAVLLDLAILALAVLVLRRKTERGTDDDWKWMFAVTLVPLVAPMLEEHHLTVLLLPITVLMLRAGAARLSFVDGALILGGVLLLASRYSVVQFPETQAGWAATLLLGKVIGTALLALALARRIAPSWRDVAPRSQAIRVFTMLVVGFTAVRLVHDVVKFVLTSDFIDFAHYYTYARLVAEGANPFDPLAIAAMDARLGVARSPGLADYPPLFYLLVQPWTTFSLDTGALLWLLTTLGWFAAALVAMVRTVPRPAPARIAAAVFVAFSYQPLYEDLVVGQSNVALLALVTLGWWASGNGWSWLAGAALGVAPHVKPQYALLVPLLWLAGERAVAVRAVAVAAIGLGVGLVLLGPAQYLAWIGPMLDSGFRGVFPWNISSRAILDRVVTGLGPPPFIASLLTAALGLAILVLVVRELVRTTEAARDCKWSLAAAAVVLLSPMLEEHHFVLLLFPLTLLLLRPSPPGERATADTMLVVLATLLLASRYSVVGFPAAQSGPLALLLAGKLLGAATLAWAIARRIRAA